MQHDSDQTQRLLDDAAGGGRSAFERLFALHRDYLKSVIRMHLHPNSRFDDSDVIQETHITAVRNFESYLNRRPMPFRLWLRKTAHQELANLLRTHYAEKRDLRRQYQLPDASSVMIARQLSGNLPTPSVAMAQQQAIDQIGKAANQLPADDRQLLVFRHVERMSHRAIAELLDITEIAARKRYGRALLRFHQLLTKHDVTSTDLDSE